MLKPTLANLVRHHFSRASISRTIPWGGLRAKSSVAQFVEKRLNIFYSIPPYTINAT
jgi:hypothetical protein